MNAGVSPTGRLAPSPTGHLHVGHARSFLLAWWHARSRGGRIVLRIEDLDHERAKPELVDACLADLAWLGLDWDGEVLFQSSDARPYEQAVLELVASGAAYACTCSRKEIQSALSAPHAAGELRYAGRCRGRYASPRAAERTTERAVGLRLRVPAAPLELDDGIVGRYRCDVQREVGDFLLARRDGTFAYQLAVVVDDARQGVNEVLRGDDLLSSAARQAHLQHALGLPRPAWFHVPLVVDPAGRRLAKRDRDLTLASLRNGKLDPRRLIAWIARTTGQPTTEPLAAAELLEDFDLARLPLAPTVFGPVQQSWLRGEIPLKEAVAFAETNPEPARRRRP